jgi:general secretion pathway protein D
LAAICGKLGCTLQPSASSNLQVRGFLITLVPCLACAAGASAQTDVRREYREGQKAERQGRTFDAWLHYLRARVGAPGDPMYARAAENLRVAAAQALAAAGRESDARQLVGMDPADDSSPLLVPPPPEENPRSIQNLREPVQLKPDRVISNFSYKGTLRGAYEEVAKRFGLRTLFDDDFKGRGDREVRFEIDDVDFPHAVVALNDVAEAFIVPISEGMFLVAEDTQAKRAELDPVAATTIDIPEAMKPEEVQELVQAIQQTLDMKRSFLSASTHSVVLRDSVRKVNMAREMYEAMAHPKGEVTVDVEVIVLNGNRTVEIGANLPQTYPITNFSQFWNVQPPEVTPEVASSMITFGGGNSIFGVTLGPSSVTAKLDRGEGRTLQRMTLRAAHGSEAEMNIGERFPIITSSFSAPVSTDDDAAGFIQPIPSITYEDLGLTLKMTPAIHSGSEVTLKMAAEFKLLAGPSVNGVPILANRTFESQVRLEEGQAAILGGMTLLEQRNSRNGFNWLAQIPWVGRLFRTTTRRYNQQDLIVSVTPHIVRLPASEIEPSLTIRFGPEDRPLPPF